MPRTKAAPKPAIAAGKVPVLLESEKAALGAALRDTGAAEIVSSELVPRDFYSSQTQKAFTGLQNLVEEGLDVNPVSVSERTGIALSELQELVDRADGVGPSQLKTLVSELNRVSDLRAIYQACLNATSQIGTDTKVEEASDILEKGLYQIERTGGSADIEDGAEVLDRVKANFLAKVAAGGGSEVSTGLRELDRAIISLSGPKVVVVAARPSMGKTALSGTLRRSVLGQGLGVLEFNLEMGREEIAERELAFQAHINLRKVLSGKEVTEDELGRVGAVGGGSLFPGLWFIDDSTYSIAGMRRKSRIVNGRLARSGKRLGMVVIDYLQLAGDNGDGREQTVAAISRGCKLMAKELGCPVMALSQLNRSCEHRDDRRPMMADLRESGAIEQDADIIMFIYREHMYDQSFPPEEAELIIRKQRSGPIGTVRVRYNPKLVTFEDGPMPPLPTPGQQANGTDAGIPG